MGQRALGRVLGVIGLMIIGPTAVMSQPLSLAEAVRETLRASPDLASQRTQLQASRESIGLARAALLPQIEGGAQGQILDDDRADGARGNATEKSATVYAGASQILYDEEAWAGYSIQRHVYESQEQAFETSRLEVIADAAAAFLQLEQSARIAEIQRQNREVTRKNMDTARARVATGYSGERDVLRWQTQLSANDTSVVSAETAALLSRFELNRVRDRAREQPIDVAPTEIEVYGFVYARPTIAERIVEASTARRFRDFMVRRGVERSPIIAAIDAQIEAEARQLTASRRSFWVPTVTFGAGVNHLAAEQSSGGQSSTTNDTEWGVKAGLTLPIFEGGGRVSELRQSRLTVSGLRQQRRAEQLAIEQTIRAAFAQASASYRSLGFAREREASSSENYDLVNQSYVAGVSSILDLLDAQTQLLDARVGEANAYYGFLKDLMKAEEAMSTFAFLAPPDDEAALLDELEAVVLATRDDGEPPASKPDVR